MTLWSRDASPAWNSQIVGYGGNKFLTIFKALYFGVSLLQQLTYSPNTLPKGSANLCGQTHRETDLYTILG